jgi:hypothetical protein
MDEKSLASLQPTQLIRTNSEEIRSRQWTNCELEAIRRIAMDQEAGDDSRIDFSDIPPLSEQQLAKMIRLKKT